MALASHMGEYFGKTLVPDQWGYENCQEMGNFLLGSLIWLVFPQPYRLQGVGGLVRIEDHTSGYVSHITVLAEKLWFLVKSRFNPLCFGVLVGCR